MTILEVRDLQVWFDLPGGGEVHAVQRLNFALEAGQRLGLVGESGCGKSTAVLALMGLLPPTASVAGHVLLDGTDILAGGEETMRSHRWSDMAMVFQGTMSALNPVQTVGAQIIEPLRVHGLSAGPKARARGLELLDMVGLPGALAARYPHELSGGQRQRVCLAMALACRPRLLFADEPTTALDVMVQAQILQLLIDLTSQEGLALVLVTHDLAVVSQFCERIAIMYAGEIVENGPAEDLVDRPRHPYTRRLFAATLDLYGDESPQSIHGTPPRLDQPLSGCPFRPRCDRAFDPCQGERPALAVVGDRHVAACHRNRDTDSDAAAASSSGHRADDLRSAHPAQSSTPIVQPDANGHSCGSD